MSMFRVRVDMRGGYTGRGFLGRMEVMWRQGSMNSVPSLRNTLSISETEGWEVGGAGIGKGRWEKLMRISSWKVYFGMISLCNREQIEVFKSWVSLTLCNFRKLEILTWNGLVEETGSKVITVIYGRWWGSELGQWKWRWRGEDGSGGAMKK